MMTRGARQLKKSRAVSPARDLKHAVGDADGERPVVLGLKSGRPKDWWLATAGTAAAATATGREMAWPDGRGHRAAHRGPRRQAPVQKPAADLIAFNLAEIAYRLKLAIHIDALFPQGSIDLTPRLCGVAPMS